VPSQNAEASLAALSEASGLPLDKCEVYRTDPGGGFGRRGGQQDYVHQAVAIAKQFPDTPVKLIWSREEDMAHDFYRPISQAKMSAGLDEQGNLVGLQVRISGQSINAFSNQAAISGGTDMRQLQGYNEAPGDATRRPRPSYPGARTIGRAIVAPARARQRGRHRPIFRPTCAACRR
jgi:isoquinoline 1-oxidoreductase subunit beta